MFDANLDKRANQLMMSPAISKAGRLLTKMGIDVNNEEELKTALSTVGISIALALDEKEITFKTAEAEAMLYCLLGVSIAQVLDGNKFVCSEVTVQ